MIRVTTPVALGAVLRQTRTAQNIRAEDLAAMLGVSPTTLRRLEQGSPPTAALATLLKLFEELGIECHLNPPPDAGEITIPQAEAKPRRTRVKT